MFNILQILAINLPLVFGASGIVVSSATVTNADIIVSSENTAKLKGSDTHMEAGVDIVDTTDKTVHEKSGLNIALSTPVTDALQSMAQSQKRAKQVTNPRLKQLYRLKAAQEAAMAAP